MPRKGQKISKPKVETRGGKRPGSGRKPRYMLTDYQIKKMFRICNKRCKEEGREIWDVFLDEAFHGETARDRLAGAKIIADYLIPKQVNVKTGTSIVERSKMGLPPMKTDPAKKVVKPDFFKDGKLKPTDGKLPPK